MAGANLVQGARNAAQQARRLADEHQRTHGADPANKALAREGEALRRTAADAATKFDTLERAARATEATRLREAALATSAGLQARLRAETQARSDAAAQAEPSGKRKRRPY